MTPKEMLERITIAAIGSGAGRDEFLIIQDALRELLEAHRLEHHGYNAHRFLDTVLDIVEEEL